MWYHMVDWGAWATLVAATVAAVVTFIAWKSMEVQKQTIKFLQKTDEENFSNSWTNQVIDWAGECSDCMAGAHFALLENDVPEEINAILAKLSSLLDRGRFLFENDRNDGFGASKPRAYQGYRPYLLDCLFNVYLVCEQRLKLTAEMKDVQKEIFNKFVFKNRRDFVSEIQEVVNPNWFHRKAIRFDRTGD